MKIKSPTEQCNQFCENCEIHLRKYLEESKGAMKIKFKQGDEIKCSNNNDMLATMNDLIAQGYEVEVADPRHHVIAIKGRLKDES
jgi:hypothetical protein